MGISNNKHVRYLYCLLLSVLTAVVVATGFVVVVDPYGLYDLVKFPRFNVVKPGLTRYQEAIKLAHAVKTKPTVVILGNSRAEIGFDPAAPAFAGENVYNLAIPGSGISTARRQLEHLRDADAFPASILLGVEFLDFVAAPGTRSVSPTTVGNASGNNAVFEDFWRFDTLFSVTSVKDAIRTLHIQENDEAQTIALNGFNPLKEYRAVARNDGYYAMFRQRAEENAKTYLRKASGSFSTEDLKHLEAILDMAAISGAEVKLIIYPYHAQILSLFEETGLWSAFEEWKMTMAREVSLARKRHRAARVNLTDFSGFGGFQCERIPAKGNRSAVTQWYWEAGHFKKELGDVVLLRLWLTSPLGKHMDRSSPDNRFIGLALEESEMAENQKRIASERNECLGDYPQLFSEMRDLVTRVKYK